MLRYIHTNHVASHTRCSDAPAEDEAMIPGMAFSRHPRRTPRCTQAPPLPHIIPLQCPFTAGMNAGHENKICNGPGRRGEENKPNVSRYESVTVFKIDSC